MLLPKKSNQPNLFTTVLANHRPMGDPPGQRTANLQDCLLCILCCIFTTPMDGINRVRYTRSNSPSAENFTTASDSVRKFPVDFDIWKIQNNQINSFQNLGPPAN